MVNWSISDDTPKYPIVLRLKVYNSHDTMNNCTRIGTLNQHLQIKLIQVLELGWTKGTTVTRMSWVHDEGIERR